MKQQQLEDTFLNASIKITNKISGSARIGYCNFNYYWIQLWSYLVLPFVELCKIQSVSIRGEKIHKIHGSDCVTVFGSVWCTSPHPYASVQMGKNRSSLDYWLKVFVAHVLNRTIYTCPER